MPGFAYARPSGLAEALNLLAIHGPDALVLAGGTDLVVGLRAGKFRGRLVVDIKRVAELRPRIEGTDERLSISATTVLAELIEDERARRSFPALVEAAATVGSAQIRNRATLIGNICNASPAADTAPALLVYRAVVVVATASGDRRVPIGDFFVGAGRTILERGELVARVELEKPAVPFGAAFARLTRRRGVDLATVSVCCGVEASGATHFGYGAVGPRPFLVSDQSGSLSRPGLGEQERDEVLMALVAKASPISDVRASREYRQAMLMVLSRRALSTALERRALA